INYHPIKSLYPQGWAGEVPELFRRELEFVLGLKPDCLFVPCNTLHKAFDMIRDQMDLSIPFFHAIHLTRDALIKAGTKKTLFLGTKFTMEDDFFTGKLCEAGIEIVTPDLGERTRIQEEQTRLAKGEKPDASMRDFFRKLLAKYERQGCGSV